MEYDQEFFGPEKSLRDYLEIVLSRLRLVVTIFLLVLAATALYTFTRIPLYTSEAIIEPAGYGGKGRETQKDQSDAPIYDKSVGVIANQIEIFSSSTSLKEAFKKKIMTEELPELQSITPSRWQQIMSWFMDLVRDKPDNTTGAVRKDTGFSLDDLEVRAAAKPSTKSGLLTVSMTAETPRLAQKMLDLYIDLYLQRNLEARRAESIEAAQWLHSELEEIGTKLTSAQANLVAFSVEHGIVDARDGGIGQVMAVVNKAVENRIRTQETKTKLSLLEKEMDRREAGSYVTTGEPNEYIGKLKQDLAMMESEYAQSRVLYSENYPKLVLMNKKIKFLRDRIHMLEKQTVTAAKELAEKEEQAVTHSYKTSSEEAARVQVLEAQYQTLKKDVDANLEFQKLLLNEYNKMLIRARTITNNLRLIDPPSLPVKPSWPKKKLNLLVGTILGIVGGIGAAFIAHSLDDSVKHHSDLERELGLRNLGVVPDLVKSSKIHNVDAESAKLELIAYDKPKSPMSDAMRNVQVSIMLSNKEEPARSLCVSSSIPGEGKTLIAVSLATVLTSSGRHRVVLVDADMRKPRVHKALGISDEGIGLADLVNGERAPLDEVIRSYRIPGFFCITAGHIPEDPVSLLSGEKMQAVMQELQERFDYVVVDCPPILGFADTPIVSSYVDGLVLVVQPGKVVMGQVRQAVDAILSVDDANILGIVTNKADFGNGYGYRYGYGGYLRYRSYGGDYYGNYAYYSNDIKNKT